MVEAVAPRVGATDCDHEGDEDEDEPTLVDDDVVLPESYYTLPLVARAADDLVLQRLVDAAMAEKASAKGNTVFHP